MSERDYDEIDQRAGDGALEPDFEGFENRECSHHRTVGPHRAWCHDCTEWCYPSFPCKGCSVPMLEARVQKLRDALSFVLRASHLPMAQDHARAVLEDD